MQEKRPLPNYGSTSTTEAAAQPVSIESKVASVNTQVRYARESQEIYTTSPFLNDLIHFGVGQLTAFFNQQKVAVPPSHQRLKQIWDSNAHACLPLLIRAFTSSELSDDNSQVFTSLVAQVLVELQQGNLSNAVKEDFIFVLKSGLTVFEGESKVKIIRAIKCFEDSIKQCEMSDARRLSL